MRNEDYDFAEESIEERSISQSSFDMPSPSSTPKVYDNDRSTSSFFEEDKKEIPRFTTITTLHLPFLRKIRKKYPRFMTITALFLLQTKIQK